MTRPPSMLSLGLSHCSIRQLIVYSSLILFSEAQSSGGLQDFCSGKFAGSPPITASTSSVSVDGARDELRSLLQEASAAVDKLSDAIRRHTQLLNLPSGASVALLQGPVDSLRTGQLQPYSGQLQRTLARGQASWSDHLTLLAAVHVDAPLTSAATLMDAPGGLAKFVAAGDLQGSVYLFQPSGVLQLHSQAGRASAVTALAWHRHNSTTFVLASAHQDGSLQQLLVRQHINRLPGLPDQITVEQWHSLPVFSAGRCSNASIQHLQAFRWGPSGAHHYISAHADRHVCLWEDDGTLRAKGQSPHPILAARHNSQGIFFTSHGLLLLHLKHIKQPPQPVSLDEPDSSSSAAEQQHAQLLDHRACDGLNGSSIAAAAWSTESHEAITAPRGFALSHEGDLLTLALGAGSKGPCKVRHRKPLGAHALPARLATIHGYLLLTTPSAAAVFNISGPVFSTGPRIVAADALSRLRGVLSHVQPQDEEADAEPAQLATSQHRLVALHLGGSVLGMYESVLPVKGPASRPAYEWLMRPLFIVVVIAVAYWQFQRARGSREYTDMRQDQLAKRWPELAEQFRRGVPPAAARERPRHRDDAKDIHLGGQSDVGSWPQDWPAGSQMDGSARRETGLRSELDAISDPLLRPQARRRMGTQPDVPLREDE